MDASNLPKGQSKEQSDGVNNLPGTYVHKDTGATIITSEGNEGVVQADALLSPVWKDAWERKGDTLSHSERLAKQKEQAEKDAKTEADPKTKKQLEEFAKS